VRRSSMRIVIANAAMQEPLPGTCELLDVYRKNSVVRENSGGTSEKNSETAAAPVVWRSRGADAIRSSAPAFPQRLSRSATSSKDLSIDLRHLQRDRNTDELHTRVQSFADRRRPSSVLAAHPLLDVYTRLLDQKVLAQGRDRFV